MNHWKELIKAIWLFIFDSWCKYIFILILLIPFFGTFVYRAQVRNTLLVRKIMQVQENSKIMTTEQYQKKVK